MNLFFDILANTRQDFHRDISRKAVKITKNDTFEGRSTGEELAAASKDNGKSIYTLWFKLVLQNSYYSQIHSFDQQITCLRFIMSADIWFGPSKNPNFAIWQLFSSANGED